MLRKQSKFWKNSLVWLVGLLVAYKVFQRTSLSPETAIKKVFQGSKYSPMIPLITAQAKHETGDFKSEIFNLANNMFGMKVPGARPSQRSGVFVARDGERYSKFNSVMDSAKDQLLYFENQRFPVITDPFQFALQLKNRGYYGDTFNNYLSGIQRFL